jgi:hypothetical protein
VRSEKRPAVAVDQNGTPSVRVLKACVDTCPRKGKANGRPHDQPRNDAFDRQEHRFLDSQAVFTMSLSTAL